MAGSCSTKDQFFFPENAHYLVFIIVIWQDFKVSAHIEIIKF